MPLPDDDLLKLLADEPVPPSSAERRADALLKANIAFREKIQAKPQRIGFIKRLLGIGPQPLESRMKMRTLMGGTALALVGVLAVSLGYNEYARKEMAVTSGQASFQSLSALEPAQSRTSRGSGVQLSDMIDSTGPAISTPAGRIAESIGNLFSSTDDKSALPAPQPAARNEITPQYSQAVTEQDRARVDREIGASALPTPIQNPVVSPSVDAPAEFQSIISDGSTNGASMPAERRMAPPPPMAPAPGVTMYAPDFAPKPELSGERFANLPDKPMQDVAKEPVTTFSADVDTASYSTVRRYLQGGQLPPPEAVRTEEMVNYFNYNYPLPETRSQPFAPTVTMYPNPWNAGTQLLHIGIKAYDLPAEARPPVNVVLLIDVSGSMQDSNKLPLAKSAFAMMLETLKPTDTVAIVTYAGYSGVALEPTKVADREKILGVLNNLSAGGGTAGAEGLRTAYDLASRNYNKEGVNRILLATDGDFNVGVSDENNVAQFVARQRSTGVFLSVLGFGMGNYQDGIMQAIAQNGNGVAAYIDNMSEARRVLHDQMTSTMFTVAKDVKFQLEFNPGQVQSYRLLGYETRALRNQDFNNDKVDAGEVGAGSEVTAIYEIVPAGAAPVATGDTGLRYQQPPAAPAVAESVAPNVVSGEIGHLRIRYKLPDSNESTLIERPIVQRDRVESVNAASADVRFSTAVAGFSRLLRRSDGVKNFGYGDVVKLAESARGEDVSGERIGFVDLVRTAQSLSGSQPVPTEEGGVAFPPPPR